MRLVLVAFATFLITMPGAIGAVTPRQAEALRGPLTPVGAERAGNAAGTIPPWTGGMTPEISGLADFRRRHAAGD